MTKDPNWMSDEEYSLVTAKTPIPTADLVIFRGESPNLETLLIKRKTGYEKGKWCVIGGRQWKNEVIAETIQRQAEDLGVTVEVVKPFREDFPAWIDDSPKQDKTKHSVTRVYPVKIVGGNLKTEGEEFLECRWFRVDDLPEMGYDHKTEVLTTLKQLEKFKNR